jgi:molybdopterin converting factor small subunit
MKITLEYVSMLDIKAENGADVEVQSGLSVEEFLEKYGLSRTQRRYIQPFVNGEKERLTTELKDGDTLYLIIPAGGG